METLLHTFDRQIDDTFYEHDINRFVKMWDTHPLDRLQIMTMADAVEIFGWQRAEEIAIYLGEAGLSYRPNEMTIANRLVELYPCGIWSISAELYSTIWKEQNGEVEGFLIMYGDETKQSVSLGAILHTNNATLMDVAVKRFRAQYGDDMSVDHIENAVRTFHGYFRELLQEACVIDLGVDDADYSSLTS